jgi:pyruvate/2-oxoglutarate dehydrogenase complex dihydrolipoamide acyltransferase (E2) component
VLLLTARAELLLPAPAAGLLSEPAPVGTTLAPGELLARLVVTAPTPATARMRATPLARSIARRHQLELASLSGSGPQGQIRAHDVRQAANLPPADSNSAPPPGVPTPEPITPRPSSYPVHAGVSVEFDAGTALARAAHLGLSLTTLLIEAVAALLPAHGLLNGAWNDNETAILRRRQHIAVGESGPEGLRWALVRDAGDLTPRGIARALTTSTSDLAAASFAVVSLHAGAGWLSAQPPLPATAAALSLAAPTLRPIVCDDRITLRPLALLSLNYDARLLDHRHAVAFLHQLRARLE